METVLVIVTLLEVLLVIVVLAVYLIAIAGVLRNISATLGQVTFGVRAIDKQTEPIGPTLRDINGALRQVATSLDELSKPPVGSD